jgi:hydrogenase nickel incorporation protein HypA/HybF
VADGATAELVFLPVRGRCTSCGNEFEGDEEFTAPLSVCPRCGGADVVMIGGDELMLESIEYRGTTPA